MQSSDERLQKDLIIMDRFVGTHRKVVFPPFEIEILFGEIMETSSIIISGLFTENRRAIILKWKQTF